jgi:hypothetical protein
MTNRNHMMKARFLGVLFLITVHAACVREHKEQQSLESL